MAFYTGIPNDMQMMANKYLQRTYGGIKLDDIMSSKTSISDHDMKMITTMFKLNNRYKELKERKGQSVCISKYEVESIPCVSMSKHAAPRDEKRPKPKQKPEIVVRQCQAIKMNGSVCNNNIKTNSEFCGRHSKKK